MNSRARLSGLVVAGSVLALALSGPAAAGPRDDVLEAMNKCAAIADGTARLACYDGLKPQLDAALAAPPPPAVAANDGSSWFGLDHLFGGKDAPQTKPTEFGSERLPDAERAQVAPPPPPIAAAQELDSISAGLTDYAFTSRGQFIVFLDNGQVWQQIDSDRVIFAKDPKANKVTISRAILGSYALQVEGHMATFKVKRVK